MLLALNCGLNDTNSARAETVSDSAQNGIRRLTDAGENRQPQWTPDGRRIVFLSERDGTPGNADVFVMNADGSEKRAVVKTSASESGFAIRPDGKKVAIAVRHEAVGGSALWKLGLYALEEGAPQDDDAPILYQSPDRIGRIVWRPDGQQIAFVTAHRTGLSEFGRFFSSPDTVINPEFRDQITEADRTESEYELRFWIMNADGTQPRIVGRTSNSGDDDSLVESASLAWSYDSRALAFEQQESPGRL